MKNKLIDLNNHLFTALERLNEEGMSEDDVRNEVRRAKAVVDVGKIVVENGRLMLDGAELQANYPNSNIDLPSLLEGPKKDA